MQQNLLLHTNNQQDHTQLEIHESDSNTKHKERETPGLVTSFGPTVKWVQPDSHCLVRIAAYLLTH